MRATYRNKLLLTSSGKLLKGYDLPRLEFLSRHRVFPFYRTTNNSVGYLEFTSSVVNEIFIDFGDGSPIYNREFSSTISINNSAPIHSYTDDLSEHKVTIWFKFPTKITAITLQYLNIYGQFPIALPLYNLNDLSLRYLSFENFPESIGGGIYNLLRLESVSNNILPVFPSWIYKSKVNTLYIGEGVKLDSISDLYKVKGLYSLTFINGNSLTDIPSNLILNPTLRLLCIGGNTPVTSITNNIGDMSELHALGFGYVTNPHYGTAMIGGRLTSWGVGVSGLTNLTQFVAGACVNIPTEAVTGIEALDSLKTLDFRGSYVTSIRVSEVVNSYYLLVTNNALITGGDSKLRQVSFNISRINNDYNSPRPNGIYQAPSGYIQGSSNGSPSSPMEMLYVLVKQYRWTCVITNTAGTGNETLTP